MIQEYLQTRATTITLENVYNDGYTSVRKYEEFICLSFLQYY